MLMVVLVEVSRPPPLDVAVLVSDVEGTGVGLVEEDVVGAVVLSAEVGGAESEKGVSTQIWGSVNTCSTDTFK